MLMSSAFSVHTMLVLSSASSSHLIGMRATGDTGSCFLSFKGMRAAEDTGSCGFRSEAPFRLVYERVDGVYATRVA